MEHTKTHNGKWDAGPFFSFLFFLAYQCSSFLAVRPLFSIEKMKMITISCKRHVGPASLKEQSIYSETYRYPVSSPRQPSCLQFWIATSLDLTWSIRSWHENTSLVCQAAHISQAYFVQFQLILHLGHCLTQSHPNKCYSLVWTRLVPNGF